jgi:hypothetical protein
MVTKKVLHNIKGLSEAKCEKMVEAAKSLLPVRLVHHFPRRRHVALTPGRNAQQ